MVGSESQVRFLTSRIQSGALTISFGKRKQLIQGDGAIDGHKGVKFKPRRIELVVNMVLGDALVESISHQFCE